MSSKSITKSVIWQLGGKFALQGIAFFTTPIFTRLLTPADYGYTALYMSWSSILGLILGLQTCGSFQNALLKYNKSEQNRYYSSIMTISLLSFVCCLAVAFLFNKFLSIVLSIRNDLVVLVICQSFASYVITFYVEKYNSLKQVEKSTLLSILQTVLCIVFSLLFVFIAKDNKAIAKIYGNAMPILAIGSGLIIFIYIKGKCFWNWTYNKFCLTLTLPLILHGIGHLVFAQSDRIMLQKIVGEKILGIYSVTYTLCSVLTIIYGALNSAWLPFYYDLKKENKNEEIRFHSKQYIKFFTLISIGFILLSYDVFKIMAPSSYNEGLKIIPFFVVSHFFNFLYLFPVNFEFFHEKTKLIPIGTLCAAGINIVANYLLIPILGIIGAALGTLIAHVLLFLFHHVMACFFVKKEYEYRNTIFMLPWTIILLIICVFLYFFDLSFVIRWGVAILLGIYMIFNIFRNRSFF